MRIKSLLFVPAKEKMLKKIESMGADAYVVDLEDSIELDGKTQARRLLCEFLAMLDLSKNRIYVRINKENYISEIQELDCFEKVGFMLPKFDVLNDYMKGVEIFKKHENIALIETPKGLVNIKEIAACPWINAIAFGAEDYTSVVNMKNDINNLVYQKSKLVTYGKAYGKLVIDTPSFQLEDRALFEQEVQLAVDLGFDAKLAISPKHIDFINQCFSGHDLLGMQEIVKKYEESGKAVVVINGKVYEHMHINRMKKIIKENGGIE